MKVVHELLRAYKLNIPVTQKGKDVLADIKLIVPLKKKWKSAAEKAKHKVQAVVDLKLPKGTVTLNKTIKLPVLSGHVHYDKGMVTLKDIKLKESWYAGTVNGKVKLKSKVADLKVKINSLECWGLEKTSFLY